MGFTPDYWKTHRGTILNKRKKRYRDDPEYREKMKQRAREYRAKKRAEREAFYANPYIDIQGQQVPALSVDQVCDHAGITKPRLKYMQKAGYLPTALVNRPARLYTQHQADLIKELEVFLLNNSDALRLSDPDAHKNLNNQTATIKKEWEKI